MPDNDIKQALKKVIAAQTKVQVSGKAIKAVIAAERAAEAAEG